MDVLSVLLCRLIIAQSYVAFRRVCLSRQRDRLVCSGSCVILTISGIVILAMSLFRLNVHSWKDLLFLLSHVHCIRGAGFMI